MAMRAHAFQVLLCRIFVMLFVLIGLYHTGIPQATLERKFWLKSRGRRHSDDVPNKLREAIEQWRNCHFEELAKVTSIGKFWSNLGKSINYCRNATDFSRVKISQVPNKDEMKYIVYGNSTEPSVVVSLGIGADVVAEKTMKKSLPKGSEFFGADPIQEPNDRLFSEFGTFFPVAVGATSGVTNASVLLKPGKGSGVYGPKEVDQVDMVTFLRTKVKRSFIDILLLDNEGPEYDLIPLLFKGALLDQESIVFCQINVEFHAVTKDITDRKERMADIWGKLVEEGRYIALAGRSPHHQRMFLIHATNPICYQKYLRQFFSQ